MKLTCAVLSIVVLTFGFSASAEEQRYAVSGAGTTSCGKWIEVRAMQSKDLDNLFVSWIQGFLSGMNTQRFMLTNQEMTAIPDPPTLLAYVDKFCRETPLDGVYTASMHLYRDIQKK